MAKITPALSQKCGTFIGLDLVWKGIVLPSPRSVVLFITGLVCRTSLSCQNTRVKHVMLGYLSYRPHSHGSGVHLPSPTLARAFYPTIVERGGTDSVFMKYFKKCQDSQEEQNNNNRHSMYLTMKRRNSGTPHTIQPEYGFYLPSYFVCLCVFLIRVLDSNVLSEN